MLENKKKLGIKIDYRASISDRLREVLVIFYQEDVLMFNKIDLPVFKQNRLEYIQNYIDYKFEIGDYTFTSPDTVFIEGTTVFR